MDLIANKYYQEDLHTIAKSEFIPWGKLDNKSILITGATGLICSFLVDVLMFRNKHFDSRISVYALSRNSIFAKERFSFYWDNPFFHYIEQNISEEINLNISVNFIIHGASNAFPASYVSDPVGTIKANLWGLDNLLSYSIKENIQRTLYISSGEVYGEGTGVDFVESYSGYVNYLNPRSCYPASKRTAENLCVSYISQYRLDIVIARPCHIYGPNFSNVDNRAFAQFFRNVLSKKNVVLKSKGEQYRSYCYVADCVAAMLTILLKGEKGNAYNIANKNSNVSVAQLAEMIANAGGQQVAFELPADEEKKGYSVITRAALNADKLEKLGWEAKYSLKEGIENTIQILSVKK